MCIFAYRFYRCDWEKVDASFFVFVSSAKQLISSAKSLLALRKYPFKLSFLSVIYSVWGGKWAVSNVIPRLSENV